MFVCKQTFEKLETELMEYGVACLPERLKEDAAPSAEAGEALFLSPPIMTERLSTHVAVQLPHWTNSLL